VIGVTLMNRQVDALSIKPGPAEDGYGAAPPTATPVPPATDYSTLIVVGVVVAAVVLASAFLYLWKRKKAQTKQ
jgi:LPXTG-motif cell wall-anchored protein